MRLVAGDTLIYDVNGNGGNALAIADTGAAGSLANIIVIGTGDFASNFGLTSASAGMGGLIAGQGGNVANLVDTTKNGTIANVTATRIAAIGASEQSADTLEADNAVRSISKIGAIVIGGIVNGTGGGGDSFGFVAEHVVSVKIGGVPRGLTAGPRNDLVPVSAGAATGGRLRSRGGLKPPGRRPATALERAASSASFLPP